MGRFDDYLHISPRCRRIEPDRLGGGFVLKLGGRNRIAPLVGVIAHKDLTVRCPRAGLILTRGAVEAMKRAGLAQINRQEMRERCGRGLPGAVPERIRVAVDRLFRWMLRALGIAVDHLGAGLGQVVDEPDIRILAEWNHAEVHILRRVPAARLEAHQPASKTGIHPLIDNDDIIDQGADMAVNKAQGELVPLANTCGYR